MNAQKNSKPSSRPQGRLKVIRSIGEMQKYALELKHSGKTIGFVPTMGALHDGHLALVEKALKENDVAVVSIFVNPTQFGPNEDFASYPREFETDREKLQGKGTHVLFAPTVEEMYPPGFQTRVEVTQLTRGLCGENRPGHFQGVTLVVTKLFNIVLPDKAYFGLKDYQQYVIVKRMVSDLNFPIETVGCQTVREEDGLAKSSRNAYLNAQQRLQATCLYRGLVRAKEALKKGERDAAEIIDAARHPIWQEADARIEYIRLVHPETLKELDWVEKEAMLMMAVRVGDTRLIDNMKLVAETMQEAPKPPEPDDKKPRDVPVVLYGSPIIVEPTRYVPRAPRKAGAPAAVKNATQKKIEKKKAKDKENIKQKKTVAAKPAKPARSVKPTKPIKPVKQTKQAKPAAKVEKKKAKPAKSKKK